MVTYYEILSVSEDATYEEIRSSYRSAVLNSHPDKSSKQSDRFLSVQKSWEVLSDARSRAVYDCEIRDARRESLVVAEELTVEDMTVEEGDEGEGEVIVLFYQCRCGDYFSIDSLDLEKMGYSLSLLNDGNKISIQTPDALPASIVLPCGSCSLKVCLSINSNSRVPSDDHL